MIVLNLMSGLVAVALMGLVLRGQYRHAISLVCILFKALWAELLEVVFKRPSSWTVLARTRFWSMTAGDWMRFAVVIFHIKGVVRIIVYDVAWIVMGNPRDTWVAWWNISFCAMATLGSLAALLAMYLNIPESERHRYSWITAPWWPSPSPTDRARLK